MLDGFSLKLTPVRGREKKITSRKSSRCFKLNNYTLKWYQESCNSILDGVYKITQTITPNYNVSIFFFIANALLKKHSKELENCAQTREREREREANKEKKTRN